MAYQPKSYRKFLAGTVTAAVVASAIAPAASAAFTDVAANDTHAVNVNKAVSMGLINGYPDGTFGTYQDITRGQVAKIIARYLGNVDTTGTEQFTDVANSPDTELKAAALKVRAAGVFTGSDGALNAGKNITRQEMASVVARLFELTDIEGVESKVTDNDKAWEVHRANINLLSEYGITTEATFNPLGNVKRGQFASFIVRAIELAQEVKIEKVTALDASGKFVEISFTKPVVGLETSDIQITDAKTGARKGVKEVKLSANGKLATVELFAPEDAGSGEVLNYLTDYTVKVFVNGETLTSTFNRPAFTEARVIDINVADKEIVVANNDTGAERTLEIIDEEFDYQAALGEIGSFWYNKDNEVVKFAASESKAKYDAIEITKTNEIKLLTEGKKYDTSDEEYTNGSDKFKFYLNGEEVEIGDEVEVGDKINFAKVGFDRSGDIEYVSAYTFPKFLVVDEVDGDEVIGYEGFGTGGSFDAEDATIIKGGKVISLEDLKQGDVLFFNDDADDKDGFAEVYSGDTVTGEIESVYDDAIKVEGKTYKFSYAEDAAKFEDVTYEGAVYLNEDGETEIVDADAAEELQEAGEVTLHFDRAGNLVYIAGAVAEVDTNAKVAILTDAIKPGSSNFNDDLVQLEVLTQDEKEELYEIRLKDLDKIIVDGKKYDIDNNNASKWKVEIVRNDIVLTKSGESDVEIPLYDAGQLVKLHLDDKDNLEELEFFKTKADPTLNKALEAGDKYADGYKLDSKTPVFIATDKVNGQPNYDADDVKVTTWGEYKGSEISSAHFVYDKDSKVIALVITATTTSDKVFEEAVITEVLRNKDKEIVEISAYVNGSEKTFEVDEVVATLNKGDVAVLQFDKSNDKLVKDIESSTSDDRAEYTNRVGLGWTVDKVDVGKKEVTLKKGTETAVLTLAENGLVLDAKDTDDIKVKSLTDLRGKTNVNFVKDEQNSKFVKFLVFGTQPSNQTPAPSTGNAKIELDKETYVQGDIVLVTLDDASLNKDANARETLVITASGTTDALITLQETTNNSGKFIGSTTAKTAGTDIVVTYTSTVKDTATVLTAGQVADQLAAAPVTAAIDELGTSFTKAEVEAARAEYDALTAEQKSLVKNYTKLQAAEVEVDFLDNVTDTNFNSFGTVDTAKKEISMNITQIIENNTGTGLYSALTNDLSVSELAFNLDGTTKKVTVGSDPAKLRQDILAIFVNEDGSTNLQALGAITFTVDGVVEVPVTFTVKKSN